MNIEALTFLLKTTHTGIENVKLYKVGSYPRQVAGAGALTELYFSATMSGHE
jgi:hypothetical protein